MNENIGRKWGRIGENGKEICFQNITRIHSEKEWKKKRTNAKKEG